MVIPVLSAGKAHGHWWHWAGTEEQTGCSADGPWETTPVWWLTVRPNHTLQRCPGRSPKRCEPSDLHTHTHTQKFNWSKREEVSTDNKRSCHTLVTSVLVPMAGWRRGMSTFWLIRDIILIRSCNFLREAGGRRRVQSWRASMATRSHWGWRTPRQKDTYKDTHRYLYTNDHPAMWTICNTEAKVDLSLFISTFIHHWYMTPTGMDGWTDGWSDGGLMMRLINYFYGVKWTEKTFYNWLFNNYLQGPKNHHWFLTLDFNLFPYFLLFGKFKRFPDCCLGKC